MPSVVLPADPAPAIARMSLLQRRWQAWWLARHPRSDSATLTQRNIYILPTRAGWVFAGTMLVLLVASINYALSLGYLLTFLLAGSGIVSMHVTHNTLRGLGLHLRPPPPVFAGEAAPIEIALTSNARRARFGVALRLDQPEAAARTWSWVDVPAGAQVAARLLFVAPRRGLIPLPTVVVESRFPLGLFRAWSLWRPATPLLAYPAPQPHAPVLPAARASSGDGSARASHGEDFDGIRSYRRGDPIKRVVWKKAARAMETGGELVSRDSSASAVQQLWLDWAQAGAGGTEARLSRLTAWVLAADRAGVAWGLRLPDVEIAPQRGESHRHLALETMALWP
ncbi:MAG TPA: DUF58 domain-containing protein [Burkholderiaceae bacterium]|jgi:uncharacterized protein (DUF58 family)|nr:DUF58 domain-containing protein [Burkholderiaceae bacterium]